MNLLFKDFFFFFSSQFCCNVGLRLLDAKMSLRTPAQSQLKLNLITLLVSFTQRTSEIFLQCIRRMLILKSKGRYCIVKITHMLEWNMSMCGTSIILVIEYRIHLHNSHSFVVGCFLMGSCKLFSSHSCDSIL